MLLSVDGAATGIRTGGVLIVTRLSNFKAGLRAAHAVLLAALVAGCTSAAVEPTNSAAGGSSVEEVGAAEEAGTTQAPARPFEPLPPEIEAILANPIVGEKNEGMRGALLFETEDNAGWIVETDSDVACYIGVERYEEAMPDVSVADLSFDELISFSSCGDRSVLENEGVVSIDQTPNRTLAVFILPPAYWAESWEAELVLPVKGYELLERTSRSVTYERDASPGDEGEVAVLEISCECGDMTMTLGLR